MNSLCFSCFSFINNILFLLIKKIKEWRLNEIVASRKSTRIDITRKDSNMSLRLRLSSCMVCLAFYMALKDTENIFPYAYFALALFSC